MSFLHLQAQSLFGHLQKGLLPAEPLKTMSTSYNVIIYHVFTDQQKLMKFDLKHFSLLITGTGIGKRCRRKERKMDGLRDNIY